MRNYFILDGQNELGPFSFEELIQKNLKLDTPIWHDDIENWTTANNLDELKSHFKIKVPPPLIKKETILDVKPKENTLSQNNNSIPKKSSYLTEIIIVSAVIVVALIIIFTTKSSSGSSAEFGKPSQEITADSVVPSEKDLQAIQLKMQQTQIDEQNKRIAEQEKKERKRVAKEKQMAIDKRVNELDNELGQLYKDLETAKATLNSASAFHLLRGNSARNEQVNDAQNQVDFIKMQIDELEKEYSKLRPETDNY